jgi:hypothetical protein
MVHGLSANHRNNDLIPDHSIARHLRAHGRDVWLLTLRSGHPMKTWRARWRRPASSARWCTSSVRRWAR